MQNFISSAILDPHSGAKLPAEQMLLRVGTWKPEAVFPNSVLERRAGETDTWTKGWLRVQCPNLTSHEETAHIEHNASCQSVCMSYFEQPC